MAVENEYSAQHKIAHIDKSGKLTPDTMHGRLRVAYFTHDQVATGDANSNVVLARLPAGRVRLLLKASQAYVNWTTSSATMDIGWSAYTDINGAAVAADPDGLDDGIDVDTAGYQIFGSTSLTAIDALGGTYLFESQDGVDIIATSTTATVIGDDIAGYLTYVID